jgi:Putative MetA-pathway of phenol degradation
MSRIFIIFAAVALLASGAVGCGMVRQTTQAAAAIPDDEKKEKPDENGKKDDGPPKTLFKWEVGGEEPPSDEPPKPETIATDRPDFTEASSTVGKGRIQLEAGYTFVQNVAGNPPPHARVGDLFHTHTYPEALLRIGMFAEWFELRLGQTVISERERSATGAVTTRTGLPDLYVGSKIALTEQKGIWPESAIILATFVPTGQFGFTDGKVLPTASYLFGWDVTDKLNAGGSSLISKAVEDDGHSFYVFSESFTVGYQWTEKFGQYTEFFCFLPSAALGPDVKPEYYFNGGLTYKVTPMAQFDVRAGLGLNRPAADFFCGAGFSVKY